MKKLFLSGALFVFASFVNALPVFASGSSANWDSSSQTLHVVTSPTDCGMYNQYDSNQSDYQVIIWLSPDTDLNDYIYKDIIPNTLTTDVTLTNNVDFNLGAVNNSTGTFYVNVGCQHTTANPPFLNGAIQQFINQYSFPLIAPSPTPIPTATPTPVPPAYFTVDVTHAFVSGYPNENSFGQGAFFNYIGEDLSSWWNNPAYSSFSNLQFEVDDLNGNVVSNNSITCSDTSCTAIDAYQSQAPTTSQVIVKFFLATGFSVPPTPYQTHLLFQSLPVDYSQLTSQNGVDLVSAEPFATPTPISAYTLSGTVYNDNNQNGVQDNGEPGYQGATVTLNTGETTTTDANGNYTFSNLEPGTYTETFTVPNGYSATTTNPVAVSLSTDTTQNFGIIPNPPSVGSISPTQAALNSPVSFSASFTDPAGSSDTALWTWGDGNQSTGTVTLSNGSGSIGPDNHTYTSLGSYNVTVTVSNSQTNLSGTSQATVAVIPSGGLASGNISHTTYSNANFSGQNISKTNMSVATFSNDNFQNTNLSQANGSNSTFTNDDFTGANLNKINLSNSNLSGSNFTNAILTQANLSNTNLTNVNFTGANLQGANLSGTTKTGVIWSNTTCPNGTNSNNHNNSCAGQGGGL